MNRYVVLLRGINVRGKNKVPMADLRVTLENEGFSGVSTYIASGNVILSSNKNASQITSIIEKTLPRAFKLDSELIKVLVLSLDQLQAIVDNKPKGFGDQANLYHSDVIFLMGISTEQAMPVFKPRDGVDRVWPGKEVVYSQRLSSLRTKSRLSSIIGTVPYRSMTIRTWSTTIKLLELLKSDAS